VDVRTVTNIALGVVAGLLLAGLLAKIL